MSTKRDIEFLFEIGSIRNVNRGWRQHLGMDCASNTEHSFRVIFLALIIARMEGVRDEEKIIKMALIHDLPESRTSDLSYVQKVYVSENEALAADDQFDTTCLDDLNKDVLREYMERKSIEAKIVKDADNLDIDLELKELEERGSKLPKKLVGTRKIIFDKKLYTKSAKKLWKEIQESDPSSWHIMANKWYKIPKAGK